MTAILITPQLYRGGTTKKKETKRIKEATIDSITLGGYLLKIIFENDFVFKYWSSSMYGCKKTFAFRYGRGAEWEYTKKERI